LKKSALGFGGIPLRCLQVGLCALVLTVLWLGVHRNGDTDAHALAFRTGETAGWNRISFPTSADINESESHFIAWWSPGHVLTPIVLQQLGVPPFRARALINILGVFIGLWGTLSLARFIGFAPKVGQLAALSLLLSPSVSQWWVYYGGGDVLAFALAPWIFRSMLSYEGSMRNTFIAIILFGLGGFLLKSSLLLLTLIWGAFVVLLWADRWWQSRSITFKSPPIVQMALALGAVAVVLAVTKFSYLNFGDTPTGAAFSADALQVIPFTPSLAKDLVYPVAGPILAWLPLELLFKQLGSYGEISAMLLAVILVLVSVRLAWKVCPRAFALLLTVSLLGYVSFFGLQYVRDASVSWEARHFIPVLSLLALTWTRAVVGLAAPIRWGLMSLLGLAWGYQHAVLALHRFPIWSENTVIYAGDTMPRDLLPVWQQVRLLDDQAEPARTLFLILPWNRTLELAVQHSRLIPLSPGNTGMPRFRSHGTHFPGSSFAGVGPEIYLVLGDTIDSATIQRSFKAYPQKKIIFESEGWKIFRLPVVSE